MQDLTFKEKARIHQIQFRKEVLKLDNGEYETFLTEEDARNGKIFYPGLDIFESAKGRYPDFTQGKACFTNMIRSEHIPFNFFVPLSKDLKYARNVFNRFMGDTISEITAVMIEHAPDPQTALKDKTSFDVYVEFNHIDGTKGILGIELKYTEGAYELRENSKEAREVRDPNSIYNRLTREHRLFKEEHLDKLPTDEFRQAWRNMLLGVSMTRMVKEDSAFEHFTSIIMYPKGNSHFRNLVPVLSKMLSYGCEELIMGITYEELIAAARDLTNYPEYLRWLQYLEDRYIVKD